MDIRRFHFVFKIIFFSRFVLFIISIDVGMEICNYFNHKNYNFLDCDWFKEVLFSTNSLVELLLDSLLLDSLFYNIT